ncbi:transcription factor bHLH18-like [Abrus precatorius]|uniref:Transcription factor bHLH18-like n=1 Tax=Abrus precatorius TaxID=3816 RepID=A0A8B8KI56_ABRPR|nr:transcription factor bHLH18-like [Abrus precatorius]
MAITPFSINAKQIVLLTVKRVVGIEQQALYSQTHDSMNSSSSLGNINFELTTTQGTKRVRTSSETQDHIMSERRRRQQMAERFIALSAIIPGLKKELDDEKDPLELEECHTEDEEFLRDILQQPAVSSESESQPFVQLTAAAVTDGGSSLSSDEMVGSERPGKRTRLSSSPQPRAYILSFDNSTIIPATPQPQPQPHARSSKSNAPSSKKRALQNLTFQSKPKPKPTHGPKKNRTDSQTLDHIMAERKRRQELTERFIALSATIPALKKTDKSSILREAINYVKQLQERVTELEQQNKRGKDSIIILKRTDLYANNEDNTSSETNSEDCCRTSEMLPDIEARMMENEVLIEIHCEKEDGVELKILEQLENLHLSVTGSSVLPFGNSTLGITIIAQMGDAYRTTVNDLVKNLRHVLSNHMTMNPDPY